MAESKTLEMRVAELEDKLSKVHITEDEMKAYHKVAALMGSAGTATPQIPQVCVLNSCVSCIVYRCYISSICVSSVCINECSCGPCNLSGTGGAGGGFGNFGR